MNHEQCIKKTILESTYLNMIKMCYIVEGYICLWACNAMGVKNTTTRPQIFTGRRARHFLHGIATELVASIRMPVGNNDKVVDAFWTEEPFDYCSCKGDRSLMNLKHIVHATYIYHKISLYAPAGSKETSACFFVSSSPLE